MAIDFGDAHDRHWDDAERLLAANRLANADHLYGFAAECGLKRLMQAFGMKVDAKGPEDKKYRVHADTVWDRYDAYKSGRPDGYDLPTNPFSDWRAEQRYERQQDFAIPLVSKHKTGASLVRNLIKQARLGGLI